MALFYVVAGINHFLHPEIYVSMVPRFLAAFSYRPLAATKKVTWAGQISNRVSEDLRALSEIYCL
jgi:uncharacterized membrane protein